MAKNASIDLHVHSSYSDGRLTPEMLAERAAGNNIRALAITDHDTMSGLECKIGACGKYGIECVAGVEISCDIDGREAHILGLFVDPAPACVSRIVEMSRHREKRMELMLEKLSGLGIDIAMDDLPVVDGGVYGRPHLARALMAKGVVKSVNEAFARLLYDGGPVHIAKSRLSVEDGIDLAKDMGGVAVIAHPGVSGLLSHLDCLIEMGLDGVEVYHPRHGGETIARLLRYCRERGLLVSGGSDFHGPGDGADIGSAKVPVDLLEPLRDMAASRKNGTRKGA